MDTNDLEVISAAAKGAAEGSMNKIANILGAAAPFWGLKKRGVEAYVKEIESSDLSPENKMMLIANAKKTFRELKNQMAIADLAEKAAKSGTDFSAASKVDEQWLSRFMDAGRHVYDEEIQLLWGSVLAGEFEDPGSSPPSVIRVLSEMTTKYAEAFQIVCSLCAHIVFANEKGEPQRGALVPMVFYSGDQEMYHKLGLNFLLLKELEQLGLIQYDNRGIVLRCRHQEVPVIHVVYGPDVISCVEYPEREFPVGNLVFTEVGKCISHFVNKKEVAGYAELLSATLKKKKVKTSASPMVSMTISGEREKFKYSYQLLKDN